jgi:hypothetical protein
MPIDRAVDHIAKPVARTVLLATLNRTRTPVVSPSISSTVFESHNSQAETWTRCHGTTAVNEMEKLGDYSKKFVE